MPTPTPTGCAARSPARWAARWNSASAVKFSLFKGPGFSVDDVVIHEDPAIGAEPIAYMDSLDVRPSIWSLLGGRFVVDSIGLEGAHINLTKSGSGNWNFLSFVNRSVMSAAPAIHIRDSRINFKFGDTKSVFYLMDTDLDISPPGPGASGWKVSLTGKPARTDRPAQGLGSFTLKGRWFVAPERVDLDLQLDHCGLGEISALLEGPAPAACTAPSQRACTWADPFTTSAYRAACEIADVHRWDLMPVAGQGWPFDVHGSLDLVGQAFDLESNSAGNAPLPLAIRFRASDYLSQPRWAIDATGIAFRWRRILELARHMGAQLPPGLQIAGVMDGAIGYAEGNLQGQVAFRDASLDHTRFAAHALSNRPALCSTAATYAWRRRWCAPPIRTRRNWKPTTPWASGRWIFPSRPRQSAWRRCVRRWRWPPCRGWSRSAPGQWSGQLHYHYGADLSRLDWPTGSHATPKSPCPAWPIRCNWRRRMRRSRDRAWCWTTSPRWRARAPSRGRIPMSPARRVRTGCVCGRPSLDAAALEAEWMPTLRRNSGLLARALGRTNLPDWLKQRAVDGTIQVDDSADCRRAPAECVRAHVLWDVARVQLEDLQARLDRAAITGSVAVNLRGTRPTYRAGCQGKGSQLAGG